MVKNFVFKILEKKSTDQETFPLFIGSQESKQHSKEFDLRLPDVLH